MPDPVTLAVLGTAVSGVSSIFARGSARRAARANRRVNDLEQERRGIQNDLARRAARAEERRLQAATRAEALAAGVGLSSGVEGASSSLGTQLDNQLGTQRQLQEIDLERTGQIKKSQRASTRANTTDQIGQIVPQALNSLSSLF